MSKDQWIAEHEAILQDFVDENICEEVARQRLCDLGFDEPEIDIEITECLRDMGEMPL